jgi:O-antigen/teichoic acid export membrane protein
MTDTGGKDRRRFALDTALLIVASGLTGVLFMLVHVALGRMMDSLDYAVLVSLLGMLNILNVPSNAIRVVLARYVAEYAHGNAVELWVTLVKRAFQRVALYAALALAGWGMASLWIPPYFEGYTTPALWMVGLVAYITLFTPVVTGTLQGARHFGWMAGSGVANALARLLFATAAVWLGGRATAVIGAVAASALAGLLIGYLPIHGILRRTEARRDFESGPVYRYLWPVLLGQGALFLLINADLILSVRFLEGDVLKAYGKAAMLSRTVLFLPLPVAVAMFPRAVTSARRGLLWAPVAFTVLASLGAAAAIACIPGLPMRLMYGVSDPLHNELVRMYVWAVAPLSLAMVLCQYLWARHQTRAVVWAAPMVAAYVAALFAFHDTAAQIIGCLGVGGTAVALWLLGAAVRVSSTAANSR